MRAAEVPAQGWNLAAVSAPAAWRKVADASAVVVAIVDSGVHRPHPAFHGVTWKGPSDAFETTMGHGTRVAAIVGGRDERRPGLGGVAPRVTLMPLKIAADGFSERVDFGRAVAAIEQAVQAGATVVNLSWSSSEPDRSLERCLARAAHTHPEVLFVTTPGNADGALDAAPRFPACFGHPNTVVVTSTTCKDRLGSASPASVRHVDLAAPGYLITTAATPDVPGGYGLRTGTSFAAPHVSGAAALLRAQHPSWSAAQLKAHLLAAVDRLPSLAGLVASDGRLNVARGVWGPLDNVRHDASGPWKGGSTQTVRWDVAYDSPVCATVDVGWSYDGGASFPLTLLSAAANTGEARITIPSRATGQGRIRVRCCGTQFFADSGCLITTGD